MATSPLLQFGLPFEQPSFEFVRHPRARRYVIRVTDSGTVRVTIPRWGSKREAQDFADRERRWIQKQWDRYLREKPEGLALSKAPEELKRHEAETRAMREKARRDLPPLLTALASRLGFPADAVKKVSIRNQKWRWGSCSPNGHICLNWRLVTMPDNVRDYVLIHELMHLKRMDHSPRFWKLVAQACPDYQAARAALRAYRRD